MMRTQSIQQVTKMTNGNFNIFGMATDHLHYIGWTKRALSDEREILSDLATTCCRDVAQWVAQAGGKLSIFEIDSAPSAEDAKDTVQFWCQYYGMLGAKVVTDHG
jgi:hypothetical protein